MKSPFFIPGPPESVDRAEISQLIRLLDYISGGTAVASPASMRPNPFQRLARTGFSRSCDLGAASFGPLKPFANPPALAPVSSRD